MKRDIETSSVKTNINFNNLDHNQKVNCVKNLLFNSDLNTALSSIIEKEKKDLELTNIIIECLNDKLIYNKIKENVFIKKENSIKTYTYSRILSYLVFYNKKVILKNFFESLDKDDLKDLAIYEYTNKTEVSISSSIFKKYCEKYEKEAFDNDIDKTEVLELSTEIDKYNNLTNTNNHKKIVLFSILSIMVCILIGLFIYKWNCDNKVLSKYKNLILPGIYLNGINLEGMDKKELEEVIKNETEKIEAGKLIVTNVNGEYQYLYKDMGIKINSSIKNDILTYNKKVNRFKKVSMIKNKDKNKKYITFKLEGSFDDNALNEFMKKLTLDINTDPKEDSFYVDKDHNVIYDKGSNGFVLDKKKTKTKIKKALESINETISVNAVGDINKVDLKYTKYKDINTKVATFTTHFANAGNRGHNIVLAASKLNEAFIEPGEEFSYIKRVGPFSKGGYLPAPVYLNNDVASGNGGGVCQLATTLYVTLLKTNLTVTQRQGHSFAPTYVKGGLDATIYSPSVDLKFKNEYEYPFFIVAYAKGNYLTVDLWTNDKTLGNKTYEPYSVFSNGGYLTYVKEYENGNYVSQRFINKTTYKPHP